MTLPDERLFSPVRVCVTCYNAKNQVSLHIRSSAIGSNVDSGRIM